MLELQLGLSEEEKVMSLMEQCDKMAQKTKEKLESLYDPDPDGSPELKVSRIFKSNCIQSKNR